MLAVTIEEAEVQLSELIDAALSGEVVVILLEGKPAIQLVPLERDEPDREAGEGLTP